eukprot:gene27036-biopygen17602
MLRGVRDRNQAGIEAA